MNAADKAIAVLLEIAGDENGDEETRILAASAILDHGGHAFPVVSDD